MKLMLAALTALLALPAFAHDRHYGPDMDYAEIQIFYGYRGYDNYDFKTVSTLEQPLSINHILAGHSTAACYKGNPDTALNLFSQMVQMYNFEFRRNIAMVAGTYYFYEDGKGALMITTLDEHGFDFLSFPRMIECDRWSTPDQRGF